MQKFSRSPISPARSVAFDVLLAVEGGSYASDDLRSRSVTLSGRDAGLAQYSGRKPADLDLDVKVALRGAIFQMRYLERIPPHAAVHDSVEFVKQRQRAATGLANAVLRKVNRDPVSWPDRATELSCPEWMLRRWTYSFGEETALAIAKSALVEPQHYIRQWKVVIASTVRFQKTCAFTISARNRLCRILIYSQGRAFSICALRRAIRCRKHWRSP